MIDFHGISLRNPVIVASCPATETLSNVCQCEFYGAGGVILKSVAPENLRNQLAPSPRRMLYRERTLYMLSSLRREFLSVEAGQKLVKESRKKVKIPIIGSVAGRLEEPDKWIDASIKLVEAGVDMLQLDSFYALWTILSVTRTSLENLVQLAEYIQEKLSIPVMLKISPAFNVDIVAAVFHAAKIAICFLDSIRVGIPINVNERMSAFRGVAIHGPCFAAGRILFPLALLYTQQLTNILTNSICAGGGVFSGEDALTLLFSGATCVQIATAICVEGFQIIKKIVIDIESSIDFKEPKFDIACNTKSSILKSSSETRSIQGQVYRCIAGSSKCNNLACFNTVMCDRESEGCEGCGLCIDVCPKGIAKWKNMAI
jgi:dihydroorotate dehydrogenase